MTAWVVALPARRQWPPAFVWLPALLVGAACAVAPVYLALRAVQSPEAAWEALSAGSTLRLTLNSAALAAATTVLATAIALPLAWLTTRTDLPGRRLITVARGAAAGGSFLHRGDGRDLGLRAARLAARRTRAARGDAAALDLRLRRRDGRARAVHVPLPVAYAEAGPRRPRPAPRGAVAGLRIRALDDVPPRRAAAAAAGADRRRAAGRALRDLGLRRRLVAALRLADARALRALRVGLRLRRGGGARPRADGARLRGRRLRGLDPRRAPLPQRARLGASRDARTAWPLALAGARLRLGRAHARAGRAGRRARLLARARPRRRRGDAGPRRGGRRLADRRRPRRGGSRRRRHSPSRCSRRATATSR